MKGINLYTANHASKIGIEDYISIFREACDSRDITFSSENDLLENPINIIIDEFVSYYQREKLKQACSTKTNKIFLVVTEFFTDYKGIPTFNNFNNFLTNLTLPAIDWFTRNEIRAQKDLKKKLPKSIKVFSGLFSIIMIAGLDCLYKITPKIFRKYIPSTLDFYIREMRRHIDRAFYCHRRYLGLIEVCGEVDGFILIHPELQETALKIREKFGSTAQKIITIYPEINFDHLKSESKFKEKVRSCSAGIEITGTITPFRRKAAKAWNKLILKNRMLEGGFCHELGFNSSKDDAGFVFSLHVPQTRNWRFSSPTRLYRAFKQMNFPVLGKKLNDHPIEDACLLMDFDRGNLMRLLDFYFSPGLFYSTVHQNIRRYNLEAQKVNDEFFKRISE